jgi:hypothetical protein
MNAMELIHIDTAGPCILTVQQDGALVSVDFSFALKPEYNQSFSMEYNSVSVQIIETLMDTDTNLESHRGSCGLDASTYRLRLIKCLATLEQATKEGYLRQSV